MATKKKDDVQQQPKQPTEEKSVNYVVACSSLSSGGILRSTSKGTVLSKHAVARMRKTEVVTKDGKVKLFDKLLADEVIMTEADFAEANKPTEASEPTE